MSRTLFCVSAFATVLSLAVPGHASITSVWEVESYKQFDEGEPKAALVTSVGRVRPGWNAARKALPFSSAWSAIRAEDGHVYFGTDEDGAIYRHRRGKVEKVTSIPGAVAVVSLAWANGALYAGTMPNGEIWEVRGTKRRKVAKLKGAETVWAMAASRDGKTVYAGTGPEGRVFSVGTKSRKARSLFETGDKRVLALTVARDGSVWFGTSEEAVLYRHDPKARTTRAMGDFAGNEVTALAAYRDGVIAAANDIKEPATSGVKTAQAVRKAAKEEQKGQAIEKSEGTPGDDQATASGAEAPRKGGRKGTGALFFVRPNGHLEQVHSLSQTYFTSVESVSGNRVFAGAADKGRVYMVAADGSVSTAFDVDERRVDAVLSNPKGQIAFVTSDASALYTTGGSAKNSTYTSKVFDAKVPATFGRLTWWGKGAPRVETRSGFTAEPGKGWSRWQAPKDVASPGGGQTKGQVTSPPGRYFQYRVKFRGAKEELRQTALYYLPQNVPTRVTAVKVGEESSSSKLVTLKTGPTEARSPVLKLSWTVENDDEDETVYELSARKEGQAAWRRIVTGTEPLTETEFSWNTESFDDGYYRLRVVASDRRANGADRARKDTYTTPIFLVDNSKPTVRDVKVAYPAARAVAKDAMSAIAEMSYSVDDGPWRVGGTDDRLFDETTEKLRFRLPKGLSKGTHTLSIRAADEAGNIGAATVTFRVR